MRNINSDMQVSRYNRFIRLIYFSSDLISLNFAYLFSLLLRYHSFERFFLQESLIVFLFSNIIWLLLAVLEKYIYPVKHVGFIEKAIVNITKVVVIHAFLIMLIIIFYKFEFISRLRLFYFYFILK